MFSVSSEHEYTGDEYAESGTYESSSNYEPSEASFTDLVRSRAAVARDGGFWTSNQYIVDEAGRPRHIGTDTKSDNEKVQATGDRARSISPTVQPKEMEQGYFQAPVSVSRGFNTLIWATIGEVRVQVLIDTGASRSLIKTQLANDLRAMKSSKNHISQARTVHPPVAIEGVHT